MMKQVFTGKYFILFFAAAVMLAAAPLGMAQDHGEVGAFVDYFRFNDTTPKINFIGLGGRVAFNVQSSIQLEAEMAYDFQRNYTNTFSNGVTTVDVTSHVRTLHGVFGPKFQTGAGPFRVFVTGKVGFDNFTVTNQSPPSGFTTSVGLANGTTSFAVYPGGGVEGFFGPIGLRAEAGDDIYFNNGAHNNLRVTFGPQFRF